MIRKLWDKRAKEEQVSEESKSLRGLGPRILTKPEEIKQVKPYLNLLKGCIENENINNIAITGMYGSGKSTILKTFQYWYELYKDDRSKRYLEISLASFKESYLDVEGENDVNNENGNEESSGKQKDLRLEDLFKRIELSILQQIIYQINPEKIPHSRFKRIPNRNEWTIYLYISFGILWLFSVLAIFRFDYLESINPRIWTFIPPFDFKAFFIFCIFAIGIGWVIGKAYHFLISSRLHKIDFKGEISFSDDSKSILNLYLEDIIYFFQKTDYQVVIFEDLDRFERIDIFTKLREINNILNKPGTVGRKIKFIYAVRDDLFKNRTDRTKFFDFIIPVIPFVDPYNVGEQFKKEISDKGFENNLSPEFHSDIMSFIGDIDMRLLINIVNEFDLYRLKIASHNMDKLMAMIIYKNLYPFDFEKLVLGTGNMYNLISKKEELKDDIVCKLKKDINSIDEKLEILEKENLTDIEELRKVYLFTMISGINGFAGFDMGFASMTDALQDENFQLLQDAKRIRYRLFNSSSRTMSPGFFETIENKISKIPYNEREKRIVDKNSQEEERLKKKRLDLNEQINNIYIEDLSTIYQKVRGIKEFEVFGQEEDLIRSLLLNGYIDEDYNDYISLFYDISITREEHNFIQKIKSYNDPQFAFEVESVDEVVERIPLKYFAKSPILNFDIIEYCLKNKEQHTKRLDLIYDLLASEEELSIKFIVEFVQKKPDSVAIFLPELCHFKTNLWSQLVASQMPQKKLENWVGYIFEYGKKEDICNFDEFDYFKDFISQLKVFEFSQKLTDLDDFKEFILEVQIKFHELDRPGNNQKDLFDFIYKYSLYEICSDNILQIAEIEIGDVATCKLQQANYTELVNMNLEIMIDYLERKLDLYLSNVLLLPKNIHESPEIMKKIANWEKLDSSYKLKFLTHQKNKISNLSSINRIEDKTVVVQSSAMEVTWSNIYDYYKATEENKLNELLIEFLNEKESYIELSNSHISNEIEDDTLKDEFCQKIIYCNNLSESAYENLIQSIGKYAYLPLSGIDEIKVDHLINHRIFSFTTENFNELKEHHENKLVDFVMVNQGMPDFIGVLIALEISDDLWIDILKAQKLDPSIMRDIISNMDESIILNVSDVAEFVFDVWDKSNPIQFSFNEVKTLISIRGDLDKNIAIIISNIDRFEDQEVRTLMMKLGGSYSRLMKAFAKPRFENNEENLTLMSKLKSRNLISSYKEMENKIIAYQFRKVCGKSL